MNIEKVIITRINLRGDRDGPYIFTKFHGVDNFVESQPLADPNGEITGNALKFVADLCFVISSRFFSKVS